MLLMFILLGQFRIALSQEVKPLTDSVHTKKTRLIRAVGFTSAYYAGSLFVLDHTWFKDSKNVPFHFYNDNRGYLQVDKCGHVFGSYVYSYMGFNYLRNMGLSRHEALIYGGTLGLVLQTPIEIMDGIHEGYGFSWGDMVANSMGSALIIGQELLFREQIVKYKFSYRESEYAKKANGMLGTNTFDRVFKDYNGHTYWLTCPVNRIVPNTVLPDWLSIAVGYGANGMYGEFSNVLEYNGMPIPPTTRYRQYYLSLDVDWTKIKTDSRFLKTLFKGMTFVKLPFPTLEFGSHGVVKGHLLHY